MSTRAGPLVFVVAGEPSGDVLGGRLMAALSRLTGGNVRFAGVGGEAMAAQGLRSLYPIEDLAVMGFAEVLPRLATILRRLRETERAVAALRPDVVVTIDAPGFTMRLARRLRPLGIPAVHYVAPQLWAWRPGRARLGIAPDAPVLALMAGSRAGLARRMRPVYGEAAALLSRRVPGLVALLPAVRATRGIAQAAVARWGLPAHVLAEPSDRRAALAVAGAAVTTSGTSTLELALAGMPMAVAYRASPASAFLARRMLRVPHVALPNLILGEGLVPELLQERCTPAAIAGAAQALLAGGDVARLQREGFARLRGLLGGGGVPPSERAAAAVLAAIRRGG
ncbi:MAG: lipid-A-disaccharide synthase [Alphaproteobacteria bacterium]